MCPMAFCPADKAEAKEPCTILYVQQPIKKESTML